MSDPDGCALRLDRIARTFVQGGARLEVYVPLRLPWNPVKLSPLSGRLVPGSQRCFTLPDFWSRLTVEK